MKVSNKLRPFVWTILFILIFILGGIKAHDIWVSWGTNIIFSTLLVASYFKRRKIKIPEYFVFYFSFLILYLVSLLWSENFQESFRYLLMFSSGGLIWLLAFNYSGKNLMRMSSLIIYLGILFGVWVLYNQIAGKLGVNSFSLNEWSSVSKKHHHIGDLWAIVGVIVIDKIIDKKAPKWLLGFVPVTIYVLLISQSRTAILSLGVGVYYILKPNVKSAKKLGLEKIFYGLLVIIFLFIATNKSLLFSRPYFFQALAGINDNPIGIGMGNFSIISENTKYHLFGMSNYSVVTHNIILEVFVGLGVFALPFLVWLWKSFLSVIKFQKERNRLFGAIFLTLTVNFFFDFTYFIPTMFFLWMASLGKFQKEVGEL